jgi:hypothetical protein
VWLGCADPTDTTENAQANDPEQDALVAVIGQWRTHLKAARHYTVHEIIDLADSMIELKDTLRVVAGRGLFVDHQRLGHWFRKVDGKIADGWKIVRAGRTHGNRTWKLIEGN